MWRFSLQYSKHRRETGSVTQQGQNAISYCKACICHNPTLVCLDASFVIIYIMSALFFLNLYYASTFCTRDVHTLKLRLSIIM